MPNGEQIMAAIAGAAARRIVRDAVRLLLLAAAMSVAAQAPSPPVLKLPDTVVPQAYDLQLKLDPASSVYSGSIAIDVRVAAPTDLIWINATGLTLNDVRAAEVPGKADVIAVEIVAGNDDVVGLRFAQALPVGAARLVLRFERPFSTAEVAGLFRQRDAGDWYVLTQMEPLYARRAFPCFDEPRFRAPWHIALTVPEGQRAFSNMPVESERASAPGWREVSFRTTPPMASYLVAIAVGPWDVLDGGVVGKNATPLRYIAPRGRAREAAYAASVTPAIVDRLETYFGQPFPFPKLDSIVIPNTGFFFGAMENAGLITYDQSILLATPAEDTTPFRQRYVSTAAHEISHQWFGDLVTPAWWNDIWLNESFATWLGNKITDEVKPEWQWSFKRTATRGRAISSDRLASARRVRQPIQVRSDVLSAFDSISYSKGAALLAMVESWLGPEKFRDGVRRYMTQHAWAVATADDFLAALVADDHEVLPALRAFVDRPGIPELGIRLDCAGAPTLELTQSRFAPRGSTIEPQERWVFPACFQFGNATQGQAQCTLIRDATTQLKLDTAVCPNWVVGNPAGIGYFLPALSPDLYAMVASATQVLGPLEWVLLLGDSNILANGAAIPQQSALELAALAARQRDPRVYREAVAIAAQVPPALTQGADNARYAKWVRTQFGPRARTLGWQPQAGEDSDTRRLRAELLPFVADRGEDAALAGDARARAMRWPEDRQAVAADVRHELLWTAARTASREAAVLYAHLVAVAAATHDARARRDALRALGGFLAPQHHRDALALVLDGRFEPLDALQILAGTLQNDRARTAALTWLDGNYDALAKRLNRDNLVSLPAWAADACATEERALFVTALAERMRTVDGGPRSYAKALEQIDLCLAYRTAQQAAFDAWLATASNHRRPSQKATAAPERAPRMR